MKGNVFKYSTSMKCLEQRNGYRPKEKDQVWLSKQREEALETTSEFRFSLADLDILKGELYLLSSKETT